MELRDWKFMVCKIHKAQYQKLMCKNQTINFPLCNSVTTNGSAIHCIHPLPRCLQACDKGMETRAIASNFSWGGGGGGEQSPHASYGPGNMWKFAHNVQSATPSHQFTQVLSIVLRMWTNNCSCVNCAL